MSQSVNGTAKYEALHQGEELHYVQQVMDKLSDGVGSLLLLLIPKQDANAPLDPELPASVQVFSRLCDNIVDVATDLAHEEYGDYPKLQKEITDACGELTQANRHLGVAVQQLASCQPLQRAACWSALGDAVKVIAGKTIQLLEIHYNCEIMRLWDATRRLADLARLLDPSQAARDAVGLRDAASELASRAKEVADYMHDQAKVQPSELLRDELQKGGDHLDALSDRLLAATNELLRDRGSLERQQAVGALTAELQDALQRAQAALDGLVLMGRQAEGLEAEDLGGAHDRETESEREKLDSRASFEPEDEMAFAAKRARDELRRMQDKAAHGDAQGTDEAARAVHQEAGNAADLARELASQLRHEHDHDKHHQKNDHSGPSSSSSSSNHDDENDEEYENKKKADLERADRLHAISDQLRGAVPPTNKCARDLAADHAHPGKQQALERQAAALGGLLDEILDDVARHNPGAIVDAHARQLQRDADALAHGPQDAKHVEEAGRGVERELQALSLLAAQNKEAGGAAQRKLQEISTSLLPLLIQQQLTHLHEPSKQADGRVYDALVAASEAAAERGRPNAAADLIRQCQESAEALKKLQRDADEKDAAGVKEDADKLLQLKQRIHADLQELVPHDNSKQQSGSADAKRVSAAFADYHATLPLVLKDSVAVIRSPSGAQEHPSLRAALDRDVDRALAELRRLQELAHAHAQDEIRKQKQALADLGAAAVAGDKQGAVEKAGEAARRQPGVLRPLAEAIAAEAKEEGDAVRHRAIHDHLDEMDRVLPRQLQAAQEALARPGDEEARRRLHHLNTAMQEALDGLSGSIAGDAAEYGRPQPLCQHHETLAALLPLVVRAAEEGDDAGLVSHLEKAQRDVGGLGAGEHAEVQRLVDEEKRRVDGLQGAVRQGAAQEVVGEAAGLSDANKRLADAARQLANHMPLDDPRRQPLQDAAAQLQRVFPEMVRSAKEALREPEDATRERQMRDCGAQLKEIADGIARTLRPGPSESLAELADALKATDADLREEAAQGHAAAAARLGDAHRRLAEQVEDALRAAARRAAGQEERRRMLAAVPGLRDACLAVEDSARMLAGQPLHQGLRFALDSEIAALARLLDEIVAQARAAPLAAIEKEERALRRVAANPGNHELREELLRAQEQLKQVLDDDHHHPEEVQTRLANLEQRVPVLAAQQDPKQLPAGISGAEAELQHLRAALCPSLENAIVAACRDEQAAALGFREAAGKGDRPSAAGALAQMKHAQTQLEPLVEAKIAQSTEGRARELRRLLDEIKAAIAQELAPAAAAALADPGSQGQQDRLHNATEALKGRLEALIDATTARSAADEALDAQQQLDELLALARDPRKRGDRGRLLDLVGRLADHLRNLIQNARAEALAKGLDPEELDRILDALNRTQASMLAGDASGMGGLDELLRRFAQLNAASTSAAPLAPLALPEGPRPEPVTLDEKLQRVAEEVHTAVASTAPATQEYLPTGLLAEEFRRLAQAAKEGNRTNMILIGRNIHSLISALVAKLLALANACKDKYLKDRLLRLVDPLRNYSTQLKILCSVKAATNQPDADADEQLASVTRSLGNLVSETAKTVDTGIKTKRLHPL